MIYSFSPLIRPVDLNFICAKTVICEPKQAFDYYFLIQRPCSWEIFGTNGLNLFHSFIIYIHEAISWLCNYKNGIVILSDTQQTPTYSLRMTASAETNRVPRKHANHNLRVLFWKKSAFAGESVVFIPVNSTMDRNRTLQDRAVNQSAYSEGLLEFTCLHWLGLKLTARWMLQEIGADCVRISTHFL